MKITLTKVYRTNRDKQGNLLKTKDGRPYERISIRTQEHGDKWISGFSAPWNDNWNEGDVINANVETRGDYLNFSKIDPMEDFESRLKALEAVVFNKDLPNNSLDDLPF